MALEKKAPAPHGEITTRSKAVPAVVGKGRDALATGLAGFLAFALILLTGSSALAADDTWWDEEWTLRKKINIDAGAAGISEQLIGPAVLVRLSTASFQFAAGKEDGTDIRFVAADDKTVLPHFIEKFDRTMEEAHVWVKVPEVKAVGQTGIWLYYGNVGPKAVKADDPDGIFDPDTTLAYHFSDKGAPPADSTANANHGDATGQQVEGALIGGGIRMLPQTAIAVQATPSLQWTQGGGMTWSAWVKPTTATATGNLLRREDGETSFTIGVENSSPFVELKAAGATQKTPPGAAMPAGAWRHLAVVAGAGQISLYVDGEVYGSLGAALPALGSPLFLGASAGVNALACEMDEMQLSKVARPVSWVKLAYASQSSDKGDKCIVFGGDEKGGSTSWFAPGGTTAILLSSLTTDGWIVIGILAVMGVISWWIMYSKMRYVGSVAKGNNAFMNVWRHVAQDLTVLDQMDGEGIKSLGGKVSKEGQRAMRQSSVFRIYHIGSEEIRHRIGAEANDGGEKGLSGRSIEAIKASMDGGLVRESQKLNRLLVLLTICISGGPFLGLLGTVIGVMITFAQIAAAGDVNVNAIAPGIAAALVATVAGLAVAIPALFGYNYIVSKVKEATSDMHVFIDEFVTKMAEFYPETGT